METKKKVLSRAKENLQLDIPSWIDQSIKSKVDRFCRLSPLPLQHPFTHHIETVRKIERDFPSTIRNSYLAIQDCLATKKGDNIIIHCLEDLEYRLLVLEIARGTNTEGWRILDDDQSSVIVIAHPNFSGAEGFRDLLVCSESQQKEKISKSRMAKAFGLQEEPDERHIFFFVDDNDFFRLIGADPLKGKFPIWWVTEVGDGIRVFYTKAREGLDTVEKCTQNGIHETVLRFQKRILNSLTWEKLYFESSLLEGMADWWAEKLVRRTYKEPDFLQHYLTNTRFMSTFVSSDELIASPFNYLRYPWNDVFCAMLFQRLAELESSNNSRAESTPSGMRPMKFNADKVRRGLQLVTQNLSLANSLTERNGLLSANFLEELARKLFEKSFGWDNMLNLYDKTGYNFAISLLDEQSLTEREKTDLQKQIEEFRFKKQ